MLPARHGIFQGRQAQRAALLWLFRGSETGDRDGMKGGRVHDFMWGVFAVEKNLWARGGVAVGVRGTDSSGWGAQPGCCSEAPGFSRHFRKLAWGVGG